MNILTLLTAAIVLPLIGCVPHGGDSDNSGTEVTEPKYDMPITTELTVRTLTNFEAKALPVEVIREMYIDVSICVAQYVIPIELVLVFTPGEEELPSAFDNIKIEHGPAWYNPRSTVLRLYPPNGINQAVTLHELRHTMIHVVLYHYGVKGGGNTDHVSPSFDRCMPEELEPISEGIHVSSEDEIVQISQETIENIWADVSSCVAQYVQVPNIDLMFVQAKMKQASIVKWGMTEYDSYKVAVTITVSVGSDINEIKENVYHEFIHVALFYYGITGNDNVDHMSSSFQKCSLNEPVYSIE